MKKYLLFFVSIFSSMVVWAQNVGIVTANPLAGLHVTDSSIVFNVEKYWLNRAVCETDDHTPAVEALRKKFDAWKAKEKLTDNITIANNLKCKPLSLFVRCQKVKV